MDYANAGGRVFASHWHNWWIEKGPPVKGTTCANLMAGTATKVQVLYGCKIVVP